MKATAEPDIMGFTFTIRLAISSMMSGLLIVLLMAGMLFSMATSTEFSKLSMRWLVMSITLFAPLCASKTMAFLMRRLMM